ncbi:hypothetical protein H7H82_03415 [Mycobacterium heidelbergense]|uniref:hypothetical protein n=1 Tax=Mycobacterium heidelbergense TaxID=53376 RepID=UPI00138D5AE0|nr:hypothetical protein [Mycobacterium heidelbergense]MCV7049663.1 hypothetical protein [Mycobacterium heidelbergense]BBZ51933.1 hypothetical protein MHEI_36500 [Mycobacterium heidelbergense]
MPFRPQHRQNEFVNKPETPSPETKHAGAGRPGGAPHRTRGTGDKDTGAIDGRVLVTRIVETRVLKAGVSAAGELFCRQPELSVPMLKKTEFDAFGKQNDFPTAAQSSSAALLHRLIGTADPIVTENHKQPALTALQPHRQIVGDTAYRDPVLRHGVALAHGDGVVLE